MIKLHQKSVNPYPQSYNTFEHTRSPCDGTCGLFLLFQVSIGGPTPKMEEKRKIYIKILQKILTNTEEKNTAKLVPFCLWS